MAAPSLLQPQLAHRCFALVQVAAAERARVDRAISAKVELLQTDMRHRIAQRDRREIKKAAEQKARREHRMAHNNKQLLVLAAVTSRMHAFRDAVIFCRMKSSASEENKAAKVIATAMRIYKWQKDNKSKRQERQNAAMRIQKTYKVHAFHQRLIRRKKFADQIKAYMECTTKEGMFQGLVKEYRFKVYRFALHRRHCAALRLWLPALPPPALPPARHLSAAPCPVPASALIPIWPVPLCSVCSNLAGIALLRVLQDPAVLARCACPEEGAARAAATAVGADPAGPARRPQTAGEGA